MAATPDRARTFERSGLSSTGRNSSALVDGADAAPAADVISTAGAAISNPRVSVLSVSPLEVTTARSM